MMKILLTGATGLIGHRVHNRLASSHDVVTLGRSEPSDHIADLSRPESMLGLETGPLYAVVHCAGIVDEDFRFSPSAAWVQATAGAKALVELAKRTGPRAMVYVSSAHVYGPFQGEIDEDHPVDPRSDYAIAHYATEQIVRHGIEDAKILILRPCAVFGDPLLDRFDRWSLIPFSFPAEAVNDEQIVLRSSGEQRRNFVSADDIGDMVAAWLTDLDSFGRVTVANPVGPDSLTVYEFARRSCETYRRLADRECRVVRPESAAVEPGDTFEYRTRREFSEGRRTVDEHLERLLARLIEEKREGNSYGS